MSQDRAFHEWPVELQAAVNAYDECRRTSYGRTGEQAMSDANKSNIAPMIMAAVAAYVAASHGDDDYSPPSALTYGFRAWLDGVEQTGVISGECSTSHPDGGLGEITRYKNGEHGETETLRGHVKIVQVGAPS